MRKLIHYHHIDRIKCYTPKAIFAKNLSYGFVPGLIMCDLKIFEKSNVKVVDTLRVPMGGIRVNGRRPYSCTVIKHVVDVSSLREFLRDAEMSIEYNKDFFKDLKSYKFDKVKFDTLDCTGTSQYKY